MNGKTSMSHGLRARLRNLSITVGVTTYLLVSNLQVAHAAPGDPNPIPSVKVGGVKDAPPEIQNALIKISGVFLLVCAFIGFGYFVVSLFNAYGSREGSGKQVVISLIIMLVCLVPGLLLAGLLPGIAHMFGG
jgi:magnesium-transporting ATPase (P-type)